MKKIQALRNFCFRYQKLVYTWLCIGIVYSLLFWPLLNSIFSITLFGFWLLFSKKSFPSNNAKILVVLFGSLYLVSVFGLINTVNTEEALFRLQQKSAILTFPLILGTTSILTMEKVRKIMLHFVAATTIACIISIIWAWSATDTAADFSVHLMIYSNTTPFVMGLFCLLSIIGVINYQGTKKKTSLLLLAILSLYIILLNVRLIMGCWFLLSLFFSFRYFKLAYQRLLFAAILLITATVLITCVGTLHLRWKELISSSNSEKIQLDKDSSLGRAWGGKAVRVAIWECSIPVIKKHWLTGVGTGDVQDTLQQTYEDRKFYFASRYNRYNAHNQYIQMALANGIAGPLILILCILTPIFIQKLKVTESSYFIFLCLFGIICFTEVILDMNKGVIWYSFFNSIFAFTNDKK